MSASSYPELNSQGSTPFGWPDVSVAHVSISRTPEIPGTHRTGCKLRSLAQDSSYTNQLPWRLYPRGSNSPMSIPSPACPFPAASTASQRQGSFRDTSCGLQHVWSSLSSWTLSSLTKGPPPIAVTRPPLLEAIADCVSMYSQVLIVHIHQAIDIVFCVCQGYFLEVWASSRTVPYVLGIHLLNNICLCREATFYFSVYWTFGGFHLQATVSCVAVTVDNCECSEETLYHSSMFTCSQSL